MRNVIYALLALMLVVSCKEESNEVDYKDQYIADWTGIRVIGYYYQHELFDSAREEGVIVDVTSGPEINTVKVENIYKVSTKQDYFFGDGFSLNMTILNDEVPMDMEIQGDLLSPGNLTITYTMTPKNEELSDILVVVKEFLTK